MKNEVKTTAGTIQKMKKHTQYANVNQNIRELPNNITINFGKQIRRNKNRQEQVEWISI